MTPELEEELWLKIAALRYEIAILKEELNAKRVEYVRVPIHSNEEITRLKRENKELEEMVYKYKMKQFWGR